MTLSGVNLNIKDLQEKLAEEQVKNSDTGIPVSHENDNDRHKNSDTGIPASHKNENDRHKNSDTGIPVSHKNENDTLPKVIEIRKGGDISKYKQGT